MSGDENLDSNANYQSRLIHEIYINSELAPDDLAEQFTWDAGLRTGKGAEITKEYLAHASKHGSSQKKISDRLLAEIEDYAVKRGWLSEAMRQEAQWRQIERAIAPSAEKLSELDTRGEQAQQRAIHTLLQHLDQFIKDGYGLEVLAWMILKRKQMSGGELSPENEWYLPNGDAVGIRRAWLKGHKQPDMTSEK
ncbi:MAG: hypothetical protein JO142_02070 [Burkholderiales bacterium]|nr:hypothetical protein [Burkholderiales bacterium]